MRFWVRVVFSLADKLVTMLCCEQEEPVEGLLTCLLVFFRIGYAKDKLGLSLSFNVVGVSIFNSCNGNLALDSSNTELSKE